jgi:hypothetical protein
MPDFIDAKSVVQIFPEVKRRLIVLPPSVLLIEVDTKHPGGHRSTDNRESERVRLFLRTSCLQCIRLS